MDHTLERAKARLLEAAVRARPAGMFDAAGYASRLEDNLVDGVSREFFEADFRAGAGRELEGKLRAAHSSAALVVNTFSRFKERPSSLSLSGLTAFSVLRFEAVFPTGLGGTPPHLDMVCHGPTTVAVESKCLEFLTPKKPVFSASYDTIADSRRDSRWFELIDLLRRNPGLYRYLDTAQLIKHALGLMKAKLGENVILFYLYWEPINHSDFAEFKQHRDEIADVQAMLRGAKPVLKTSTYPEMWENWLQESGEAWLKEHLDRLQRRYGVII